MLELSGCLRTVGLAPIADEVVSRVWPNYPKSPILLN